MNTDIKIIDITPKPVFILCDGKIEITANDIRQGDKGQEWSGMGCHDRLTLLWKRGDGALLRLRTADEYGNNPRTTFYWVDWS